LWVLFFFFLLVGLGVFFGLWVFSPSFFCGVFGGGFVVVLCLFFFFFFFSWVVFFFYCFFFCFFVFCLWGGGFGVFLVFFWGGFFWFWWFVFVGGLSCFLWFWSCWGLFLSPLPVFSILENSSFLESFSYVVVFVVSCIAYCHGHLLLPLWFKHFSSNSCVC